MNKLEQVFDLIKKYGAKLTSDEEKEKDEEAVLNIEGMTSGTLADGTTIYTDAEEWAVGVRVFREVDGEAVAVADGELTLDNGQVIVISEGVIASVGSGEETEEEDLEASAEEAEKPEGEAVEQTLTAVDTDALAEAITAKLSAVIEKAVADKVGALEAKLSEKAESHKKEIEAVRLAAVSRPPRGQAAPKAVDMSQLKPQEVPFAIIEKFKNA